MDKFPPRSSRLITIFCILPSPRRSTRTYVATTPCQAGLSISSTTTSIRRHDRRLSCRSIRRLRQVAMQRSGAITIAVTSPIYLFLSILLGGNRTHLHTPYVPNHSAAAIGPFPNLPSAFRDKRPATHPFHTLTITCSSRRSRAAVPHQASKHRGTRIECMDAFLACATLLAAAGELASHDTGRHDTQTYTRSTTWRDNGKTVAKMEVSKRQ